jgi:hypothetical protein
MPSSPDVLRGTRWPEALAAELLRRAYIEYHCIRRPHQLPNLIAGDDEVALIPLAFISGQARLGHVGAPGVASPLPALPRPSHDPSPLVTVPVQ